MTTAVPEKLAYSKAEAYRKSGLGRVAIDQLIATGDLPTFTAPGGKRERIFHEDLERAVRALRDR